MKKYIIILALLVIPLISGATTSYEDLGYEGGDVDPNPNASNCVSLSSNMRYQSRDANTNGEVSTLQDFLQSQGYLNSEPTGYFGLLTLKAAKYFQSANNINPTGYVGPITRAKISAMTCGETSTLPPVSIYPPGCTSSFGYSYTTGEKCDGNVMCTMDAKQCPDGSYVGRTGPRCEFAACPTTSTCSSSGYDTTTGFRCGCNSTSGYSYTNGEACDGSKPDGYYTPVITGIDGPTSLYVNEEGTWNPKATFNLKNPDNEGANYWVIWGDGTTNIIMQHPSFSHSFSQAGSYNILFYVQTNYGTAQKYLNVKVKAASTCSNSGYDTTTGFRCGCTSTSGYSSTDGNACDGKLTITTSSKLPNAKVGQPYSVTINTIGDDPTNGYNWSVDSRFPMIGFSFGPAYGSTNWITGTPSKIYINNVEQTIPYTFTFTISVSSGSQSTSKEFTLTVEPATTTNSSVLLSYLSPYSGPVGTQITIKGSGFTSTGNKIKFGDLGSENNSSYSLNSFDGKTLVFNVPSSNYMSCWYSNPACMTAAYLTQPGTYEVSVTNANGTSNVLNFAVTSGTVYSNNTQ